MIQNVAGFLTNLFIQTGTIAEVDRDIYRYSFEVLLSTVINACLAILIILLSKQYLTGSVFLITYLSLRRYTGGWHAPTYLTCIGSFIVVFSSFLWVIPMFPENRIKPFVLGLFVLSIGIICWLAPAAHPNKPLTIKEKRRFKRNAVILIVSFSLVSLFALYVIPNSRVGLAMAYSMGFIDGSVIVQTILNRNKGGDSVEKGRR